MDKEYTTSLLEQSSRTAYTLEEAIKRMTDKGWRIHTWTVLNHSFVSDDSNHGSGGRYEITASVLWIRDRILTEEST